MREINDHVINPANEEPCGRISLGSKDDVDKAVGASQELAILMDLANYDKHGGHALRMRQEKILPKIFNHHRAGGVDAMLVEETIVRDAPAATAQHPRPPGSSKGAYTRPPERSPHPSSSDSAP